MNVSWWLAWSLVVEVTRAFCPSKCSCDDVGPSAHCVGVGVSVVPILFNPSLRFLNLAHNSIKSVAEALVFFDQLEELDLSHNQLSPLGIGNFEVQVGLRELRLSHNNFSSLSPGSLRGLSSLTLLDLSHNVLTELPPAVLIDVYQLKILLLSHNKLHKLSQHTFRRCPDLHVLDLCDNYFRHVPTDSLKHLVALKALHLCRNRLTTLEPNAFHMKTLSTLSLETNSIDYIADTAFHHLQELLKLNLNENMLQEVPIVALQPLINLNSLHLSRNKLKTLNKGTFKSLGQLVTLEISRCPLLESIHPSSLRDCVNLQSLTLSHNALLTHLPKGVLTFLPKLKVLNLRGNALQVLPATDIPWGSINSLDLRDNPLVCNCSLQWLAVLLRSPNTTITAHDLQCSSPDKLKGIYVSRLSPKELECVDHVQIVVGIVVLIASTVLLLALSVVLCRYHRRREQSKLGNGWPPELHGPWPPDDHAGATRHIMADEFIYTSYSPARRVPVVKV